MVSTEFPAQELDTASLPAFVNPDGVLVHVSAAFAKVLDKQPEQIIGRKLADMFANSCGEAIERDLQSASAAHFATIEAHLPPFEDKFRPVTIVLAKQAGCNQNRGYFAFLVPASEPRRHALQLRDRGELLELAEAKERFDLAVRGSSVGLWDWNLRNDELYLSPRFKELVKVKENGLTGQLSDFGDRLHPDDSARIKTDITRHLDTRVPFDTEFRLICDDGSEIWVHARGQAVWSAAGEPLRMAGSVRDITERKRDDRARSAVNTLLTEEASSVESRIAGLLDIGAEYLQRETGAVSHRSGDRFTIEFCHDKSGDFPVGMQLDPEDSACALVLRHQRLVAFPSSVLLLQEFQSLADKVSVASYVGAPLVVGAQRYGVISFWNQSPQAPPFSQRQIDFVGFLAQFVGAELARRDSRRSLVASAEALRRQRAELDLIFNAVPARIWYKDDKNRILRLNKQAAESMGMSVEQAEGADTYDLFPDMAAKYHADDLRAINSGEPSLGIVEEYAPASGERGWVSTDKVPHVDEHTGQRSLLVVAQDITSLKQTQARLEAQTEELLQSNRDLDHFAYIASHDLRAPMRGIENLAGWIEEDLGEGISEDVREKLHLMSSRVSRMDKMLQDILVYSRAGRHETLPERLDMNELVCEAIEWSQPPEHMRVYIDGELPTLLASRTAIQQLFVNLVSNAVKHHDRDHGKVVISCQESESMLQFRVTDDGPGIPEQFREKAFQMFQTLRRQDEIEGSGIGLAIVNRIVQALGGRVWIESPVSERGTSFYLALPAALQVPSAAYEEEQDDAGRAENIAVGGWRRARQISGLQT